MLFTCLDEIMQNHLELMTLLDFVWFYVIIYDYKNSRKNSIYCFYFLEMGVLYGKAENHFSEKDYWFYVLE